ncbi:hypothetical protein Taro_054904 [Colocasia esculenta]|uniref:Uncharacterized protein n=1 Tax=Colocasia esculenta TaxID=4460 RepID=A0A843XPP1_COLES|nr:hypothetical protein [Colocasia esculenta]
MVIRAGRDVHTDSLKVATSRAPMEPRKAEARLKTEAERGPIFTSECSPSQTSQFGLSSLAFVAQHQQSGGLGGSEPLPFGLSHRPEQESILGLGGRRPIFLIFIGVLRAYGIFLVFGGIFGVFRVFGIFLFFGGIFGVFRVFGIFLFFGSIFLIFVSKGPSLTQEIFWLLAWKGPVWGSFTFGLPQLLV